MLTIFLLPPLYTLFFLLGIVSAYSGPSARQVYFHYHVTRAIKLLLTSNLVGITVSNLTASLLQWVFKLQNLAKLLPLRPAEMQRSPPLPLRPLSSYRDLQLLLPAT